MHEVWPGHFLQFLHANRAPSKFGQVFVGYAFGEGWAHYAEEMMRGGRAGWKQFHDELMRYGGPPIPLVRRAMLGPDDRGSLF